MEVVVAGSVDVVVTAAVVVVVVAVVVVVVGAVLVVAGGTEVVGAMASSVELLELVGAGTVVTRTWLTDVSGRPAIAAPATTPEPIITTNLSHVRGRTHTIVPTHPASTTSWRASDTVDRDDFRAP
ncbi:MAG: hypothetical protein QOD72_1235 [Acidimicrobiaceae bacterium]|nr:hypothetical protein [Acidimicrobiaceae bacterium]